MTTQTQVMCAAATGCAVGAILSGIIMRWWTIHQANIYLSEQCEDCQRMAREMYTTPGVDI